jgi:hypothetical protein
MSSPEEFVYPTIYNSLADYLTGPTQGPRLDAVNVIGVDSSWVAKCCADLDKLPGEDVRLKKTGQTTNTRMQALRILQRDNRNLPTA